MFSSVTQLKSYQCLPGFGQCALEDTKNQLNTGFLISRILWTWKGPAPLSMPAIADTDRDGKAEIVVQAADGTVLCLDAD